MDWRLDIVGGPFDGAPGLMWDDGGGKVLTPLRILVGVCAPGARCGAEVCRGGRAKHVSFWTPYEDEIPAGTFEYEREDERVERVADELKGIATYAHGGLKDPRNFGEKAREPVVAGTLGPLTPVGSGDWGREAVRWHPETAAAIFAACPVCMKPAGAPHAPDCPFHAS